MIVHISRNRGVGGGAAGPQAACMDHVIFRDSGKRTDSKSDILK